MRKLGEEKLSERMNEKEEEKTERKERQVLGAVHRMLYGKSMRMNVKMFATPSYANT